MKRLLIYFIILATGVAMAIALYFYWGKTRFTIVVKNSDSAFNVEASSTDNIKKLLAERGIPKPGVLQKKGDNSKTYIPIEKVEIDITSKVQSSLSIKTTIQGEKVTLTSAGYEVDGNTLRLSIQMFADYEKAGLDKGSLEKYINRQLIDSIVLATQTFNKASLTNEDNKEMPPSDINAVELGKKYPNLLRIK